MSGSAVRLTGHKAAAAGLNQGFHWGSPCPLARAGREKKASRCAKRCDSREVDSLWQSIGRAHRSGVATLAGRFLGEGELITGAVVSALLAFSVFLAVCFLAMGAAAPV